MKISLPNATEWNGAENCAINLRSVRSAGVKMCEPVGSPTILLNEAGAATFLLDGNNVLSVSDDHHEVYVNGAPKGSLSDPLINVLPLGTASEAVLFTDGGIRWLSDGKLQDPMPDTNADILSQGAEPDSVRTNVLIPDLIGYYPRLSELLDDKDSENVTAALNDSLSLLISQAKAKGLFTHPYQMAWRMVDSMGHVVCAGTPQTIGDAIDNIILSHQIQRTDDKLTLVAAPVLELPLWSLHVKVGHVDSKFWRDKVAALEILAWPMNAKMVKQGYMLSHSSKDSALITNNIIEISPSGDSPRVVARIENPLNGVNMNIDAQFDGETSEWVDYREDSIKPSALYRGGSLVAYAESSCPGMIMLASGHEPLQIKGRHKICGGSIQHICAPVGGGGGWNYGRLHLLVFATDGIYSVSVDSRLTAATSTCINFVGIASPDAVAVTPEAVYVATEHGRLLRIVGARCHMVPFPSRAVRLAWNDDRAELWVINEFGAAFVMDADGGVALRSDVYVDRVVGQRMIVDVFGALRSLRVEEPVELDVSWTCRREDHFRQSARTACWKIDAAKVSNLMLRLWVDNGATSQRLLQLKVDGTINAPISAHVICPRRAYFSAQIHGKVTPPARFNSLEIIPQ